MDQFVTVAIFTLPHELAVVRARLEWEGITCFAKDENIVSVHPLYSNLVGGIKLQVPAEDVEQALAILREGGHLEPESEAVDANGGGLFDTLASISGPSISKKLVRPIALGLVVLVVLVLILLA